MNGKQMRVITLKSLWELFLRRLVLIVLGAALTAGGVFLIRMTNYEPEYTSTATLYILRQDEKTSGDAADDFSLALKLVNDCTYLLKSHAVLDEVINALDLDMTYQELYSRISAANPANTRILEVTVTEKSPEEAKRIVDSLCTIGPEKIDAVMGLKQINLFEYGTLNHAPSNAVDLRWCALAGLAAAVVIYSAFLIRFLLDDRIRSDDDLEALLGLRLLAEVPDAKKVRKGSSSYHKPAQKKQGTNTDKKHKEAE